MDFKSMLNQLSQLSEATKETKTGRVHKAEPGGYGRKFDTDEEGEEKKEKKAEGPKKRGRPPATGAHSKEEQKKAKERDEAGKRLQSHIVGNLPKSHSKTKGTVVKGKAQSGEQKEGGDKKKKSVKEWIEEVEQQFIAEATPGQALQVKPMPGAAQLVDPATQKVMATGDAAAVKNIQGAVAQGKVQMRGEEMTEGSEPVASGELLKFAQEKANHMGHQTYPVEYKGRIGRISGFRGDDTLTIEFADKPGYVFSGIPKNAVTRYQPVQPEKKSSMWESAEDYSAKKARAGKDIGKPGKAFAQIAKSAGERYGSKERGEKVAGAVLAKLRKSHTSESVNESVLNEAFTVQGLKQVVFQLVNLRKQAKLAELGQGRAPNPTEVVNTLYDAIVAIEDVLIPMMEKQAQSQVREGEIPHESGVDNIGAGLGAGRSQTTLEAKEDKKAMKKDHKAEKEGKKVTKDMEKVEEAAKPDYIDLDKDGNKKESMKKAADDKKKKKVNESMHKHSAARLMGKAHALAKEGYNCRYDDMDEAKMYHEGYKEGLDECYGIRNEPIVGMEENMPATVPGMASQAMPAMEDDMMEMDKTEWMKKKAKETPGPTFKAFGQTMNDSDVLDEFAFESWDKELDALLTESSEVTEGMTVSISKGQQGSPDSVSVTAQDGEADALLGLIKQAGLGLFGDDAGQMPAGPDTLMQKQGGINVVGDHDGMMALIKKVAGGEEGSSDYEDEEGSEPAHDEHGDEEHEHTHEETCNECGYMESKCECEGKEMVDEVESEDQMAYEVAEDNAPDSGAAETTADENAEAAEDNALAVAAQQNKTNTVNEWANQVGKGPGKGTDASFEQDIEFMTKFIAGGLNKPKSTGQTTIPVIAGQETRMEDPMAWAKLAGIKK